MLRRFRFGALLAAAILPALAQKAGPASWQNDLAPITATDWNYDFAAHLLERAGFGGTPDEIQTLVKLTPAQAVARLVHVLTSAAPAADAPSAPSAWAFPCGSDKEIMP